MSEPNQPKPEKKVSEEKKPSRVKSFFVSFVNVKKWISYDELTSNTKNVFGMYKRLVYKKPTTIIQESFEESIKRQGLTELDLAKRKRYLFWASLMYGVIAIVLTIYGTILLIEAHILSGLMNYVLAALMYLYAYRENLWFMQIKLRKLGCNFNDWIAFILRGAK